MKRPPTINALVKDAHRGSVVAFPDISINQESCALISEVIDWEESARSILRKVSEFEAFREVSEAAFRAHRGGLPCEADHTAYRAALAVGLGKIIENR